MNLFSGCFWRAHWDNFLGTLSFNTRLVPARMVKMTADLGAFLVWQPVVGVVVGAVAVLPLLLLHWLAPQSSAAVQALLYCAALVWVTRGLHWDGWADIWDAWGSNARGETFWRILKDSRVGAFGVMGLVLGLGGQILLVYELVARANLAAQWSAQSGAQSGAQFMLQIAQNSQMPQISHISMPSALAVLFFAPVLGRCNCVFLSYLRRKSQKTDVPSEAGATASLGAPFVNSATTKIFGMVLGVCLAVGALALPLATLALALVLLCPALYFLNSLAAREGRLNGDFLGASIIWGELAVIVAALC